MDDLAIIVEYNLALARETEDLVLDRQIVRPGVAALLANCSRGVYFVAEMNAKVVGQVMITYEWSDWRNGNFWWLQSVYVHKDFRSQGVLKSLFDHILAAAQEEKNVCGFRLYMDKNNVAARKVYARIGMEETNYEVFERLVRNG